MKNLALLLIFFVWASKAWSQTYAMEGNELKIDQKIEFKSTTSTELSKNDLAILDVVKKFLTEKTYVSTIRIEGHVSTNSKNDQELSEKRALTIAQWLIKEGIDCKRLLAVGFGNTKPIADNSTANGKELNTRITFIVAALRNKLIGGMPADGGGQSVGDICDKN